MCKLLSEVRNLNPGDWNICISTGIFVNASDTGKWRLNWFHDVPLAAFLVSYKTNGEVMSHMLMEDNVMLLAWCWCQNASVEQLHTSLRQQQEEETQNYQWVEKGGANFNINSKHTLILLPPKYPYPCVPLVSELPPQPFYATCRAAHWHTWLRDFDALYLIMNYASAAVTLKNAITSVIRQMGRFCLAYAVHPLSPVWGEKHLVTHTSRACGNVPVSTVRKRQNPWGHYK